MSHILKTSALLIIAMFTAMGQALAADIVIGIPSWSSANATAHVLKDVIEKRLNLDVDVRNGTNEEIFAGMDAGTMHVHPEVWLPNHIPLHNEYIIRRKSVVLSEKAVPAEQGICVTKQTADAYNIRKIEDLSDPAKAVAFDTNEDGRGELWVGAKDWSSTRIEKIRARSYGHAKTMQLLEAEETVAMAAIDAAVAVERPMAFFCYAPHYLFSLHDIVLLEEPPHDPRAWTILDPAKEPDWLTKSSAKVAWATSFLHVAYSSKLADQHPKAAKLLSSIKLDVDTVSEMTYAIVVDGIDPAEFAAKWVDENSNRVDEWLAAE